LRLTIEPGLPVPFGNFWTEIPLLNHSFELLLPARRVTMSPITPNRADRPTHSCGMR
jgi:hypothetical protein